MSDALSVAASIIAALGDCEFMESSDQKFDESRWHAELAGTFTPPVKSERGGGVRILAVTMRITVQKKQLTL